MHSRYVTQQIWVRGTVTNYVRHYHVIVGYLT